MGKRVIITVANILFPPLAVMLITGSMGPDVLINCVLFLLAVIPSHVHGFYISLVYFNRKRKVRKGIWPGEKRSGIYSDKVNNGGASRREVQELKEERDNGKLEKRTSQLSRPGVSRQLSNRIDQWDDGLGEAISRQNSLNQQQSGVSRRTSRRSQQQQITSATNAETPSRSRSRSRSLTRRLSNRIEDQVIGRLAARDDRRRQRERGDAFDDANSYSDSTEVPAGAPVSVRRWR